MYIAPGNEMQLLAPLRHQFYSSLITLLMATQLLNLSIDAIDPFPHFEDIAINEIESCIELVVEVVLGHENAITETDGHEHSSCKTGNTIVLFSSLRQQHVFPDDNGVELAPSYSTERMFIKSPVLTIFSPPPRSA
jgi:hypothetical protein